MFTVQAALVVREFAVRGFDHPRKIFCVSFCRSLGIPYAIRGLSHELR